MKWSSFTHMLAQWRQKACQLRNDHAWRAVALCSTGAILVITLLHFGRVQNIKRQKERIELAQSQIMQLELHIKERATLAAKYPATATNFLSHRLEGKTTLASERELLLDMSSIEGLQNYLPLKERLSKIDQCARSLCFHVDSSSARNGYIEKHLSLKESVIVDLGDLEDILNLIEGPADQARPYLVIESLKLFPQPQEEGPALFSLHLKVLQREVL